MTPIVVVAKDLSMDGVVICRVQRGSRLGILGYHLHAEDEQKNPHHLVLKDGFRGNNLICIPTTVYPSPVGVLLPEPIYLTPDRSLVLGITNTPKVIPARAWGTVWVL